MAAWSGQEGSPNHRPGPDASTVRLADRDAARPSLKEGLWEVRADLPSQRIARLLLCFHEEQLVVLHGFIKKTQKMAPSDLALARRRMKETTK